MPPEDPAPELPPVEVPEAPLELAVAVVAALEEACPVLPEAVPSEVLPLEAALDETLAVLPELDPEVALDPLELELELEPGDPPSGACWTMQLASSWTHEPCTQEYPMQPVGSQSLDVLHVCGIAPVHSQLLPMQAQPQPHCPS